jgi:hypothetical protein
LCGKLKKINSIKTRECQHDHINPWRQENKKTYQKCINEIHQAKKKTGGKMRLTKTKICVDLRTGREGWSNISSDRYGILKAEKNFPQFLNVLFSKNLKITKLNY